LIGVHGSGQVCQVIWDLVFTETAALSLVQKNSLNLLREKTSCLFFYYSLQLLQKDAAAVDQASCSV
jgi:hypothetical protein